MSKFKAALGGNAGTIGAIAVVVSVLALGAWIGKKRDTAKVTPATALLQPQDSTPQPDKDTPTAPAQEVAEDPQTAPATDTAQAQIAVPAFDEVRREPDGMTVVAGRAEPGATVQLMRDGEAIATTTADGSGKFATLAIIAPDGQGHVLSLMQQVNGTDTPSSDEIILAPTEAPVVVADTAQASQAVDAAPTEETPVPQSTMVSEAEEAPAATAAVPAEAPAEKMTSEQIAVSDPTNETLAEGIIAEAAEPSTPTDTPATKEQVAVLKSTADGVELLNAEAPEVMDAVALDTISYSDAGDVQLAGRAQPDAQAVRVYLDNDAVINLPVDAQGRWRGDVPDVDEGIYTLRVDEVAADGSITSRVETPFKRESTAVLAQASAAQDGPIKAITVQAGATLWAIARDRYGDGQLYVRVFKANESDIRDPDLIYPGQVFDLPD
ncbi:MAG: LysM peptidoglycan-binding domain-containing protein [Sulfitobacter sp.]